MLDIKQYCHEEVTKAKKLEKPKENSDSLSQLLQSAKMDLRDKLKRPPSEQDRQPFSQLNF